MMILYMILLIIHLFKRKIIYLLEIVMAKLNKPYKILNSNYIYVKMTQILYIVRESRVKQSC